jgi:hypothetical protein
MLGGRVGAGQLSSGRFRRVVWDVREALQVRAAAESLRLGGTIAPTGFGRSVEIGIPGGYFLRALNTEASNTGSAGSVV